MARRMSRIVQGLGGLLGLCLLFAAWDDQPNALEIYLKRSCTIAGNILTLQNIVQSSFGKNYSLDFAAVRLPYTAGRFLILSPYSVREALKDWYSGSLIMVGQRIIVMPASAADRGNAWFYENLLEYISSQIPLPQARLEVEITSWPRLPDDKNGQTAFNIGSSAVRNGVKAGPALIAYRGLGERVIDAGAFLHTIVPVAVPTSMIQAGQRFEGDALAVKDVDLSQFGDDLLFLDRAVGSFTASSALLPGEPIPLKKITRTLFVRSGDKVEITFIRKNITVNLRGRALGSGGLDDRIAVKADNSDRRFQATITGDKEVLIEL
jgi:flagella basal body P-ring formation protein FlgA